VIYLIHWNNLCECHKVPPSITTVQGEKTPYGVMVEEQREGNVSRIEKRNRKEEQ
jgi:hypothetical protein